MHAFLAHRQDDAVGVAIRPISEGESVTGITLDGGSIGPVTASAAIPIGHKIALLAVTEGTTVIEYGQPIGVATKAIAVGDHVHVHNLRSLRWQDDGPHADADRRQLSSATR